MAEINASGFNDENDETIVANRSGDKYAEDSTIFALRDVIWYVVLALGVPGNLLSAIVWLRREVTGNNSSAVYLAALAVNDLAFLLFDGVLMFIYSDNWFYDCCLCLLFSAFVLEPLLVLSFSVERLIAILCPLQVLRMFFCVITSFSMKK